MTRLIPALAVASVGCASAPPPPRGEAWLAAIVEAERQRAELPALAAVVVGPGDATVMAVSGVREVRGDDAATLDDLWQLGSITKTLTSSIVGQLVREGKLGWTSSLASLFPEAQLSGPVGAITVRALADHRSGLPRDPPDAALDRDPQHPPMQRRRALIGALAGVELGEPRVAYSNYGYHLLGAIAERVTGESWESLVTTRLAQPLGITIAFGEPRALRADAPASHVWRHGRYAVVPPWVGDVAYDTLAPAGHATVRLADLARLLASTARAARDATWVPTWFFGEGAAGLGRELVHDGTNGRNFARAIVYPDRGVALAIVCNCGMGPHLEEALDAVRNAVLTRWGADAPVARAGVLEGEELAVAAWSGDLSVQRFAGLSGGRQLWWTGAREGDRLVLRGRVEGAGWYRVRARLCFAPDYGEVELSVGEAAQRLSARASRLEWRDVELGTSDARQGLIEVSVRALSTAGEDGVVALLGLDALHVEPATP